MRMTMRYVHPAEEHKRFAAGKLETFRQAGILQAIEKRAPGRYNFRYSAMRTMKMNVRNSLKDLVGAPGFEPGASCAQGLNARKINKLAAICSSGQNLANCRNSAALILSGHSSSSLRLIRG
jgi:hypothetical protein